LDLYGGIGNLSAAAVQAGVPTTLLEREGSSCADARHNFRAALKAGKATILEKDAAKLVAGEVFFDVALLDPPRAGAPGVLAKVALTRPRAILYLSCDPVSLARDLSELRGYRVEAVQPYDMFPGTEHVESLALLLRG
jgi:23S rRNA (uracil1939-C5)-methyltransferase